MARHPLAGIGPPCSFPGMNGPPSIADSSRPGRQGERAAMAAFALWVALMGVDRIDLAGGAAGVVLTPFLTFTPVLLVLEAARVSTLGIRIRPPDRRAAAYALVLASLLGVAALSGLAGVDVATSAKRSAGLAAISVGTLLTVMAFVHRPRARRAMAAGAEVGLVIAVLFDVALVVNFIRGGTFEPSVGPVTLNLEPATYAGVFPRLSGQVSDANRAGLLYVVYLYLIFRGRPAGARRRVVLGLGMILTVLTLSRSAVLTGMTAALVGLMTSRSVRISTGQALVGAAAVLAVGLVVLGRPDAVRAAGEFLEPVSTRLSLKEGSTQEHAYLLRRGAGEATQSVPRAALGLGYGASFRVLEDVFPGNRYGNFHSIYVSLAVESGIVALLLMLLLLGYPLLRPGPYLPLVAGLCIFNIFYQASAEPSFWFALALAWLTARSLPAPSDTRPTSR